ncbi:hypothetical protein [Tepidimonas sp.]|uniref:hypothetical protein n=1 Tax=Tepidimonas sp. TaxID=2002775 RepID=UPI004054C213
MEEIAQELKTAQSDQRRGITPAITAELQRRRLRVSCMYRSERIEFDAMKLIVGKRHALGNRRLRL